MENEQQSQKTLGNIMNRSTIT